MTTIDRIVTELGLERVDFIKMDIEGAKRNALPGARETIRKLRPRMALATENLPDDPRVIPEVVAQLNPADRRQCGQCTPFRWRGFNPRFSPFTEAARTV